MKLQQRIAGEVSQRQVGRTLRVLTDAPLVARTQGDAPEVDCRVLLDQPAPVGEFIDVRVDGTQVYDLTARRVFSDTKVAAVPMFRSMGVAAPAGGAERLGACQNHHGVRSRPDAKPASMFPKSVRTASCTVQLLNPLLGRLLMAGICCAML